MNGLTASAQTSFPVQVPQPPIFKFLDSLTHMQVSSQTPFTALKLVILFGLALYIIFGIVLIRQVGLMSRTVQTPISSLLRFVVWGHLFVSIFIWLLAAMML